MLERSRAVLYGSILVSLLIVGCTPPAATNRQEGSTSSSAQSAGKDKPVQTARQSSSSSGLEAYREGKAPDSPLKEIYFDFDKYDLKADARQALQANAAWLKTNAMARVEIEGYCDERGTNEYNLALGAKRAQSAKDYLVTLGVGAQRISTISYGKELPACREHTEECWQKNRRDRFAVQAPKPVS